MVFLNNDIEIKARIFALKRHTHLSYKILQGLDVLVFLEMKNKVYSLLLYGLFNGLSEQPIKKIDKKKIFLKFIDI